MPCPMPVPALLLVVATALAAATGAHAAPAPPGATLHAADPLAAARAAFANGRFAEAKDLAKDAPGLAGAALEKLGDEDAACALYEKDRASPRGPAAALRAARCRDLKDDVKGARAAFDEVARSPLAEDPLVLAQIAAFVDKRDLPAGTLARAVDVPVGAFDDERRSALADALFVVVKRGGDGDKKRALGRLLVELPDTDAGKKAAALPEAKAFAPKTLDDALARANALAERQQSDAVVALLVPKLSALSAKDTTKTACEARLLVGKAYRKLRKYAAAKKELDLVASRCSDDTKRRAAYLEARVAFMGKSPQALPLLRAFVAAWPKDALTDDVLLWLGEAEQQAGDEKKAEAAWTKIVSDFPDGDMIHDARFRLAWARAEAGDTAGARALLDDAARHAGGRVDVADRALYWHARLGLAPKPGSLAVTADDKQRDEALAELVALADSRPASWYGVLARLLVAQVPKPPKLADPGHLRAAAEKGFVVASPALAKDPRFALAEELVDGGYDDEALLALASLDLAKISAEDRFAVALLEERAGDLGAGHAELRDGGLALLPGTPSDDNALAWSLDWPLAHEAPIAAAADENKVPRALLFGLAREESAFDAGVVSWAGAVGLCQLMMPTAKDEAKDKKLPVPTVDALKDPSLNARLGASHLSRRLRGLKHPALAIAAYNAGPGAVMQWSPKGPLDAFVEQIPVDETRNYVKKVTGSWATYAILDGSIDEVAFPLVL